jgi:hypothetical protein
MTAYRSNASDNHVYFHICDPYQPAGNDWTAKTPQVQNCVTQSSVALCYWNLTTYLFFGQSYQGNPSQNVLAYCYAIQPSPVPLRNNEYWDFSQIQFSSPTAQSAAVLTLGPSAAVFSGSIWVAHGEPGSAQGATAFNLYLYKAALPALQSGPQLNLQGAGPICDQSNSPVSTNCEPVLLTFQGGLYCFFVNTSNVIQYLRLDQPSSIVTVGSPGFTTDAAPGVATDPTGSLVILCYKTEGGTNSEIWCTWSADLNSWFTPQDTKQRTSTAPTLYASNTGQILMAYRSGSGGGGDARMFTTNPLSYWYLPNGLNVIPGSS